MKKFLALYIGSATAAEKAATVIDENVQARGMAAWGNWMNANQSSIIDAGGPLGPTKRASSDGVADTRNSVTGYVIVEAESHDAAARMFKEWPKAPVTTMLSDAGIFLTWS